MIGRSPDGPGRRFPEAARAALGAALALLLAAGCGSTGPASAPPPSAAATSAVPAASSSAPPYDAAALRNPAGRFFGVAADGDPGELAPVTAFAAKTGQKPDLREYYQEWGEDFSPEGNKALWDNGQLPMLTWVPGDTALSRIASGADDAYLTGFARQVRSYQGPLVLGFAPEMNGPWNAWGPGHATADDFVKAWRHVHDVFRSQQATNVIWAWTAHAADSSSPAPLRPYYPGDDYTDWVGLIGYYGPREGSDFRSLFTPTVRAVRAFSGKPLLLAETAVAEGPRKAAQIGDLFSGAAATEGLIGLVWFDLVKKWPGSSQPADWRIDSSQSSAAAVRKAAAARKFGSPPARH